ncbi:MAG: GAF domain-containing protein [Chloroflexi bacterium]|nr:GAF domain-containing protein [Chloroflexota bacterium]
MGETFKQLFAPPVYPEDEEKTRIARLLNIILLVLAIFLLFNTIVTIFFLGEWLPSLINAAAVVIALALFAVMRRGHVRAVAILTVAIFWTMVAAVSFLLTGYSVVIVSSYFVIVLLSGVAINKRVGILVAALSIAASAVVYYLEFYAQVLIPAPGNPLVDASATAANLFALATILYLTMQNLEMAQARFQENQKALQEAQVVLEERVAERTRDLALAGEVGRSITAIRNVNALLSGAVNIIQSYFDLYYVQIYLVDETRGILELKAAHGHAAEQLLSQAHFLPINNSSINGTAALEKRAVLVTNTAEDPAFRPNSLLPDTRSEMAVPLISANKVLGVLDLQSVRPYGFSADSLPAFEALAGQLAVALENAALFSAREETSRELQTLLANTERQAQQESSLNALGLALSAAARTDDLLLVAGQQVMALTAADQAAVVLLTEDGKAGELVALAGQPGALHIGDKLPVGNTAVGLAVQQNRVISLPNEIPLTAYLDTAALTQDGLQSLLVLPLKAGSQTIGALTVGRRPLYTWTDADVQFIQQIAALLASRLESLRLTERVHSLADIVENHPDFISIAALDGRVLYANPSGLAMLGLPADHTFNNFSAAEFYIAEDAPIIHQTALPTALENGLWTGELHLRTLSAAVIPVEAIISVNNDEENAPLNFSITMHDITDRLEAAKAQSRLSTQLEERLAQVNALQRTMTREGWSEFLTAPQRLIQGFAFDDGRIHLLSRRDSKAPNMPQLSPDGPGDPAGIAVPLLVRGETIGVLSARHPAGEPLSAEQQDIVSAISAEVADALERARLFEEMQLAQAQMEKLYAGSERLVQSQSIQEVLAALVDATALHEMDQVSFLFFDKPWTTVAPEQMTLAATWNKAGKSAQRAIGTAYMLSELPSFRHIKRHEPTIFRLLAGNPQVGPDAQRLADALGAKSAIFFPLVAGDQWFGFVAGLSAEPLRLTQAEIRQISSLTGLAASVSQTQRLFDQTQQRARREQSLREVTARVFAAADADTILQTAVREVSRTLGLETFIYLRDLDEAQTNGENGRA